MRKLGFRCKQKLERYFSKYGQISHVSAPIHSKDGHVRPANLGVVVMDKPVSVLKVLAHGMEHWIEGIRVQVSIYDEQCNTAGAQTPSQGPQMEQAASKVAMTAACDVFNSLSVDIQGPQVSTSSQSTTASSAKVQGSSDEMEQSPTNAGGAEIFDYFSSCYQ